MVLHIKSNGMIFSTYCWVHFLYLKLVLTTLLATLLLLIHSKHLMGNSEKRFI